MVLRSPKSSPARWRSGSDGGEDGPLNVARWRDEREEDTGRLLGVARWKD